MNSAECLTEGFYCVNESREIVSGPHKNSRAAYIEGLKSGEPFAIMEVLEEFNNFAWGE
jgi:hypothetical protein